MSDPRRDELLAILRDEDASAWWALDAQGSAAWQRACAWIAEQAAALAAADHGFSLSWADVRETVLGLLPELGPCASDLLGGVARFRWRDGSFLCFIRDERFPPPGFWKLAAHEDTDANRRKGIATEPYWIRHAEDEHQAVVAFGEVRFLCWLHGGPASECGCPSMRSVLSPASLLERFADQSPPFLEPLPGTPAASTPQRVPTAPVTSTGADPIHYAKDMDSPLLCDAPTFVGGRGTAYVMNEARVTCAACLAILNAATPAAPVDSPSGSGASADECPSELPACAGAAPSTEEGEGSSASEDAEQPGPGEPGPDSSSLDGPTGGTGWMSSALGPVFPTVFTVACDATETCGTSFIAQDPREALERPCPDCARVQRDGVLVARLTTDPAVLDGNAWGRLMSREGIARAFDETLDPTGRCVVCGEALCWASPAFPVRRFVVERTRKVAIPKTDPEVLVPVAWRACLDCVALNAEPDRVVLRHCIPESLHRCGSCGHAFTESAARMVVGPEHGPHGDFHMFPRDCIRAEDEAELLTRPPGPAPARKRMDLGAEFADWTKAKVVRVTALKRPWTCFFCRAPILQDGSTQMCMWKLDSYRAHSACGQKEEARLEGLRNAARNALGSSDATIARLAEGGSDGRSA